MTHPTYYSHVENLRILTESLTFSPTHTDIKSILNLYDFLDLPVEEFRQNVKLQTLVIEKIEAVLETSKTEWEDEWIKAGDSIIKSIVDDEISLYTYMLLKLHPRIVEALTRREYHRTGNVFHFIERYRRDHYTRRYECYNHSIPIIMPGAAEAGHLDVVEKFLPKCLKDDRTLHFAICGAARRGHIEVVKILIPHVGQNRFLEIMAYAIAGDQMDIVKLLLPHLGDLISCALTSAARMGRRGIVEYLLSLSDDVRSALYKAAEEGHVEIVRILLPRSGPCPDALRVAARYGHLGVVELLSFISDENGGRVALDRPLAAAISQKRNQVISFLLQHIEHVDKSLSIAAKKGRCWIIERLLAREADGLSIIPNEKKENALIEAVVGKHMDVIELLLPHTVNYRHALDIAAWEGRLKIFKRLLPLVSDLNGLLWSGIVGRNLEIITLLLPYATNVDWCYFESINRGYYNTAHLLAPQVTQVDAAIESAIRADLYGATKLLLPRTSISKDLLLRLAYQTEHFNIARLLRNS